MKSHTEFKAFLLMFAVMAAMLMTGCQTVYLTDKTVKKNGESHVVTAIEASVLSDQKLQDLDVDYNGVKIKVANWSTKGDAEFIKAVGDAIVNGILAYGTMGGTEAVRAAVKSSLSAKAPKAASDCVGDACAPAPCPPGEVCAPVK